MSDDDIFSFEPPSSSDDEESSTPEAFFEKKSSSNFKRRGQYVDVPLVGHLLRFTFARAAQILRSNNLNTEARAVYDIVNEGTDGEVDIRVAFYKIESTLVLLHSQKRFVNAVHETLERFGRESNASTARFGMYIDCWVDYVDFALSTKVQQYQEFAARHGLKALPSISDRGVYPYVSASLALLGGDPPGDTHFIHGDISGLQSRSHALISLTIGYCLQIIIEKESTSFEDIFSS